MYSNSRPGALVGLHRAVAQGDQRAGEAAAQRHGDEQPDLDLVGGHTDGTGRLLVAADGEDPVAPLRLDEHVRADSGDDEPPHHGLAQHVLADAAAALPSPWRRARA